MISKAQAKKFCKDDISMIENYDKAIADTTQTWDCHHRDEVKILPSGMTVIRSRQDLIDTSRYYGCPANELIFLTRSEHVKLHNTVRTGERHPLYGLPGTNKGKTFSKELKHKIAEAGSHRYTDPDQRKKTSEAMKAWWAKRKAGGK